MELGPKIQQLREHFRLTQQDLAEILGVTKSHISTVESSQRGLSLAQLAKIIEHWHVDARFFFDQLPRLDEALMDDGAAPTTENMLRRLEAIENKLPAKTGEDRLAERLRVNEKLRQVVQKIAYLDGTMLDRVDGMIYGYLAGRQDAQAAKSEESSAQAG